MRDDCEAFPTLARVGRLNRRVQGKHVGLERDRFDVAGHLAQLFGVVHQRADVVRERIAALLDRFERIDHLCKVTLAFLCIVAGKLAVRITLCGAERGVESIDDAFETRCERYHRRFGLLLRAHYLLCPDRQCVAAKCFAQSRAGLSRLFPIHDLDN